MKRDVNTILEELNKIDTSNSETIFDLGIKKELDNKPKLVIKPNNNYEILYIKNLIKQNELPKPTPSTLEVLLQLKDNLIGVGKTEFCYENIMEILNYNPRIKMGILINNNINLLTMERILLLPRRTIKEV